MQPLPITDSDSAPGSRARQQPIDLTLPQRLHRRSSLLSLLREPDRKIDLSSAAIMAEKDASARLRRAVKGM